MNAFEEFTVEWTKDLLSMKTSQLETSKPKKSREKTLGGKHSEQNV